MADTEITDERLDAIESAWRCRANADAKYDVLPLVAALRSERTQTRELRSAGLYLDPDPSPTESDALRVKRAQATDAAELRSAYTIALQARVERTEAELERERTQNRERGAFLLRLRGLIWLMYPDEISPEAKRQFDAVFDEVGAAARAVLSTQEESK